jgi:CheY-like chemotaxis protein/Tfp pilus assembly protein PilF
MNPSSPDTPAWAHSRPARPTAIAGAARAPAFGLRSSLPLEGASALVIDGSPTSRTTLAAMLRDFGAANVVQSSRAQDARRLIEHKRFDLIVCEYHFDGQPMTGQDLMDDLRLGQLLPLSTVVVMISSEAAYANVAEAAEAALDAYLIKPHTEAALRDRIQRAFARKREMKEIIDLVESGEFETAATLCEARCAARGTNWINAARIGAELCLKLGRMDTAQRLFQEILATHALPWARLGYARTEYQAGAVREARRTLESLLNDQPGYADAYDVMGRALLDQGEPDAALHALRRACELTPGSITRLLKLGLLAFYHGDPEEAAQALQRAASQGMTSKVFDLQGLVLLGFLQYDRSETRGLGNTLRSVSAVREQQAQSARLRRFEAVLSTLQLLQQRRLADVMAATEQAVREVREPDFEFEAACNLLALLSRLMKRELRPEGIEGWVADLGDRFAVSRTTCDLMRRACSTTPDLADIINTAYASVCEHAEAAVAHTVAGEPRQAAALLLHRAEQTLNAKLIDLAQHTLQRHKGSIADADELRERANALDRRYRSYGTQVQLQWRPPGVAQRSAS